MRQLWRRIQFLFSRGRWDRDLQDEMRFHREMRERRNREDGMHPDDAYSAAERKFGNATLLRENARDAWGWRWLESLVHDVRYALRGLRNSPGFTTAAVLTLALGIGANTAIFTVIDAVLWKSLPVERAEELHHVEFVTARGDRDNFSWPLFQDFRDRNEVFSSMYVSPGTDPHDMRGSKGPVRATLQLISGGYFPTLGVKPIRGRFIAPEHDAPFGAHAVAVISFGFWTRYFSRDESAIGQTLQIGSRPFAIIGVAPPEFFGDYVGEATDVWVPATMQREIIRGQDLLATRNASWLNAIGRLKPGITPEHAQRQLTALAAGIHAERSKKPSDAPRALVKPAFNGLSGLRERFSQPLRLLMAIVALLLLLASANVANLLIARSDARSRETAIRLSIGCGPMRLIRQFMTEALVLAALGCTLGLLLARWGSDLLIAMASRPEDPYRLDVAPDLRVLLFSCSVSLASTLIFGLLPAWRASLVDVQTGLRTSATYRNIVPRFMLGRGLVALQVGISTVLLFGAGLFIRTLVHLRTLDAGFAREGTVQLQIDTQASGFGNDKLPAFYARALERARQLPGVQSASFASKGMIGSSRSRTCCLTAEGRPRPAAQYRRVNLEQIMPEYLDTMGMRLIAGRNFRDDEGKDGYVPVVVNQALALRFFEDVHIVGRRIGWGDEGAPVKFSMEIIGVVADAKYVDLREKTEPMLYLPVDPDNHILRALVLRTSADPRRTGEEMRRALLQLEPGLDVAEPQTIAQALDRVLLTERLVAKLTSFFGVLAVVLAGIGLFGVVSYRTARRTSEIGIRMALGAEAHTVRRMILLDALPMIALGILAGSAACLSIAPHVESFLVGVSSRDAASIAASAALLMIAGTFAAWWPARRASRIQPYAALRME